MGYSVGKSSFGDLAGVVQEVASADVANQDASLCYEFDTTVAKNGDRLTVNEGIRSRERQAALYAAWKTYQRDGHPYASLAAYPYTSTHDHTRGSALDFGITRKDGTNRALTQAEFDWVHVNGPRRGIQWTGRYFNPQEQWHHNGGYAATVPAIAGVIRPGEPLPNIVDPSTASNILEEESVQLSAVSDKGKPFDGDIVATGDTFVRHTTSLDDAYSMGRFIPGMPAAADSDGEIRGELKKQGRVINQGQLQKYVQHVRTIGGYVDPRYKNL